MKSVIATELISLWHLQLQKYNVESEGEAGKGWRGDLGLFYLAGMQDASLQYHSISPEWLISCGVAAQTRKRKKKKTISTGMLGHLMLYLIAGLYNSVKSGPKAVCSVSSLMFALNSDITAALQEVSPHCGSGGNYGSFSQNVSGYIILQQWKVNRAKPNCEEWT